MNLDDMERALRRLQDLHNEDEALCKFWLRINHSYQTIKMDGYELEVDDELVEVMRPYLDKRLDKVRAEIKSINDTGIYVKKLKRKIPFITRVKDYIICKLK